MAFDGLSNHCGSQENNAARPAPGQYGHWKGRILNDREQSSEHKGQETTGSGPSRRFPRAILATGFLALLAAAASGWLIQRSAGAEIHCDSLAPLTVLATLAAFLISVCFRQMGRYPDRRSRWVLFAWVLVAGATLFADFRFVRHYRGFCGELRQQLRQAKPSS